MNKKILTMGNKDTPEIENSELESKEQKLLEELSNLYVRLNTIRESQAGANTNGEISISNSVQNEDSSNLNIGQRIILVSRCLPFQVQRDDTKWKIEYSQEQHWADQNVEQYSYLHRNTDCVWLGGLNQDLKNIEPSEQIGLRDSLYEEFKYYPVFLNAKKEQMFHEGFCSKVMWPLFHSTLPTTDDQIASVNVAYEEDEEYDVDKTWQAYVSINQAYADAIREVYQEGDLIWIQDYHFTLLPQMIRSLLPNSRLSIGFFLHVPFPSSEIYRVTKHREEILQGMLCSDIIGFQTYEYARHFQSAAVRVLGLESNHKGIQFQGGHFVKIAICPVGIEPKRFHELAVSDNVQHKIRELENQFYGKRIVLGITQVHATSGLVHKFLAIDELFTTTPELIQEIVFIEIVHTNSANSDSCALEAQVDSMVSRINSKLQTLDGAGPIQYITRHVPIEELVALYCVADVLITSPIRDGMNLIPFEYVTCREAYDAEATVVLSEFAGSATSLGGAFLINPWNTEEFAQIILEALDQDEDDRIEGHQHMQQYVSTFTSHQWAKIFLEQLIEENDNQAASISAGRELMVKDMLTTYERSKLRFFFFNYEGVLSPSTSSPIPELMHPSEQVLKALSALSKDPKNIIVIVSARSASIMEKWFGSLPVILAAEYGVYLRWKGSTEWKCIRPNLDMSWWEHVMPLLDYYTERTPGAFIERKESAITWHYRGTDLDHGFWQSTELQITLREVTRTLPISIIPGDKSIELRPRTVSKAVLFERIWNHICTGNDVDENLDILKSPRGRCASSFSDNESSDMQKENTGDHGIDFVFVIAPGSDRTDEDLFSHLVPPPIDLKAYCEQLELDEKEEEIDKQISRPTTTAESPKRRVSESGISSTAAERFPSALLTTNPTTSRRDNITEKSKFTPRTDFPPSAALFKAMRRKYGNAFEISQLPKTAAACWALVLPPNARAKIEEQGELSKSMDRSIETNAESADGPTFYENAHFPIHTFVTTMGRKLSQAPYYLRQPSNVLDMLHQMVSSSN